MFDFWMYNQDVVAIRKMVNPKEIVIIPNITWVFDTPRGRLAMTPWSDDIIKITPRAPQWPHSGPHFIFRTCHKPIIINTLFSLQYRQYHSFPFYIIHTLLQIWAYSTTNQTKLKHMTRSVPSLSNYRHRWTWSWSLQKVTNCPPEHKAKLSHELIAAAASYEVRPNRPSIVLSSPINYLFPISGRPCVREALRG